MEAVFNLLPTIFRRSVPGRSQRITAASATVVFDGLVNNTKTVTHAPGPNGLPGGYPVQVGAHGVEVVLPPSLSLEAAVQINEAGLRFDGIEHIEEDGTVMFVEQNMAPLKALLGYQCQRMPLTEVEQWAHELRAKYDAILNKPY